MMAVTPVADWVCCSLATFKMPLSSDIMFYTDFVGLVVMFIRKIFILQRLRSTLASSNVFIKLFQSTFIMEVNLQRVIWCHASLSPRDTLTALGGFLTFWWYALISPDKSQKLNFQLCCIWTHNTFIFALGKKERYIITPPLLLNILSFNERCLSRYW